MKKHIIITLALLIVLGLTACGMNGGTVTTEAPATEAPTAAVPTTEAPATEAPTTAVPPTEAYTTETPANEAPATEVPTTETPPTEAPSTAEPVTEAPSGSGSELLKDYQLKDGVIVIDGVLYQSFYDDYSKFVENGWDFEFGDRTVKESDVLNAHTYVIGGVYLYNEKYIGESDYVRPSIYIGFFNNTSENLPYKQCKVLGIEVEGTSGFDTYESRDIPCYDFEIPGGIKRGATMEQIKAAYGDPDPDATYECDYYVVWTYDFEDEKVEVKLTVYYDTGLQGVEINDSRQWLR